MSATTISIDGKRIFADIPYNGGLGPKQAKEIHGARAEWDKTGLKDRFIGWSYPLDLDVCFAFRRVFGRELQVSNELADWARQEIKKRDELETNREGALKEQTLDYLADEAPQLFLAMKSRPYQTTGTAFLTTAGQCVLGDDPGLGKTIQTLGAIIQSDARTILVGCKKTATSTVWERETERWTDTIATYVAQGTHAEREAVMKQFASDLAEDKVAGWPHPRRMLIINIEMIRAKRTEVCPEGLDPDFCNSRPREQRGDHKHKYNAEYEWPFLFELMWDAIVLDESHNLLASTANYQSKRITQARFGASKLRRRLREGGLAVALSGTWTRSDLTKAWGTLNWLRPDKFGSFWRWAERYFTVTNDPWGRNLIDGGAKVPEPKDKGEWDAMLRPYFLGREKAVVASDLPPVIYAGTPPQEDPNGPCYVRLDMDHKQATAYHQMVADAEADIEGGNIKATGILAEITRQRQFATSYCKIGEGRKVLPGLPSNKIEWIVDFMQEHEGGNSKVVIASEFTEVVELTATVLRKDGWEVLTLTGATSAKNRKLLQERFQNTDDSLRVVIINTKAGGESITLDAADEMVVIDDPWKSDTFKQLRDRIHRVSRVHQVIVYRLISNGTIEEDIASLSDEQRRIVETSSPKKLSEMLAEAKVG